MNASVEKNVNGNGEVNASAAVVKQEPEKPVAAAQKPNEAAPEKKHGANSIKAVVAGIAVIAVLMGLAFIPKQEKKSAASLPAPSARSGKPQSGNGGAQPQKESPYGSPTPTNSFGSNNEPTGDSGKIGPDTIAGTGRQHPKETAATNLGEVPAINPPLWQPAPYQGQSPDAAVEQPEETRSEREALEKASLVFVLNRSGAQGREGVVHEGGEIELGLGLPTGTRLRAHLTSAVNTAVKTPVVAVVEYNYEKDGEILIPAGSRVVGRLESADRSGYIGVHFDTLEMPNGGAVKIDAEATDLRLRPLKGRVEGKNTGKNLLVRSLSGIGEAAATIVGQGSLNQPLSEADLLRGRAVGNIGQASDEEVQRLALNEHIVVSLPADTKIYVVLEKEAKESAHAAPPAAQPASAGATSTGQLRQLLQLQRELNQTATEAGANQ